jgi:hypothetical protein
MHDGLPPNGTLNYVKPKLAYPQGAPSWGRFIGANGTFVSVEQVQGPHSVNSALCRPDGSQIAVLEFQYTQGALPAVIADTSNLGDYTHFNGEPGSGVLSVVTGGSSVLGLQSIRGTTETDICNNRGLCDTKTGLCKCFDTWTSSDGGRQGKAGSTRDCGYRNDRLYSFVE